MKFKKMIPRHGLHVTRFLDAMNQGRGKSFETPKLARDDIALLQYTGGTTGVAKGAMLTQFSITSNVKQVIAVVSGVLIPGEETILTALPIYHVFAMTVNFLTFQALGMHSVMIPRPVPIKNTVDAFRKYPISVALGVNTLFNSLCHDKEFQALRPRIKVALGGGMAVLDAVAKKWLEITGIRLLEGFGLTEASPVTHVSPVDGSGPSGSIGLPVPGTEAMIVDEAGKEVPIGEPGEMIIRGPQLMLGYWKRPEETAKTIKDGWLWTGDMATMDAKGFFRIVDRKKDMILVSGFNVYPNEVEGVIASHPKVLECAVIGVSDGAGSESVKAFVVAKDESLTETELKDFCRENLTGYKRPRTYEFRKDLPKSNVGKILRKDLRDAPKA